MSCISVVGITWLASCVAGARVFQAAGVTSHLQAVAICCCGFSPRDNMKEGIFQNKAPLSPVSVCRLLLSLAQAHSEVHKGQCDTSHQWYLMGYSYGPV